MKLRFEVNQAEALRRGVDCPKSIVTVEVDPAKLSQEERNLIADRMSGIDVMCLKWDKAFRECGEPGSDVSWIVRPEGSTKVKDALRVVANLPTFESLMEAIVADEKELETVEVVPADREPSF
jgi:hypothetical protein